MLWLLCYSTAAIAQTVTIGSTAVPMVAPAISSYFYGPIYRSSTTSVFDWSRYAYLYTPAELNLPTGAVITELAWLKADAGELTGNNVFNVLLDNTARTTLGTTQTWGALTTTATSVYSSTTQQFAGAAGTYFSVTLSQPFVYTGGNLLVLADHQKLGTATAAVNFITNLATGYALGSSNSMALTSTTALVTATYGDRRPTLRVTFVPGGPCTAPPTAGTTTTTATSVCAGAAVSLSLQGSAYGSGQTYQWQESTNGTIFTDIVGATATYYGVASVLATRTYRARLTCSGQSATSTPVTVTVNPATYASLPVLESFESTWIDACATHDVATNNWRTTPTYGDASWRRDDDGASAAWTSPTVGVYTPAGSEGTHSARFHSYYAGVAAVGKLDLYANLSTVGSKRLTFDYLNAAGNDSLFVEISADGGVSFGAPVLRLGLSGTAAQGWITQTATLTSTAATAVVRFRTKVTAAFTSDIGLDNVRVESTTGCLVPVALAVTGITAAKAVASWANSGTGTYSVSYGPTGFNPALPSSTTNAYTTGPAIAASPYTITGLTASTTYQFYVVQNCAAGATSGIAGPVSFTTACPTPTFAALPLTESFENTWVNRCDTRDVPSNSWRNTPPNGNNSWRREDDGVAGAWVSPTNWSYTPTGSQGMHSARFHSGQASSGLIGTLDLFVNLSAAGAKRLSFDYINTSGSDSLVIQLSNDGGDTFSRVAGYGVSGTAATFVTRVMTINSNSATAVIRFRGRADFGLTDIGLDNIVLEPAAGCLTPASLATTTTTATTATVSWLTGGTGTYSVIYGPTGFNPTTGGTTISGLTAPPYTITGLTASTTYQFYAVQNCAAGATSGTAGPVAFTTVCITPLYATLPVLESFETTWISRCTTNDVPTNNWCNTPATGNNSWRRDDDGLSATWTSPTVGVYAPLASQGTHSARFHSYYAGAAAVGIFDLFVNLSAAGTKRMSFDYVNTAGNDSLFVQVSTDGGITFGARQAALGVSGTVAQGWNSQVLSLTSTSATTVVRFRTKVTATFTSDIGLDNVRIELVSSCLSPNNLTATTTQTTAALSWLNSGAGTYTVVYGPMGFNPATGGTAIAGIAGTSTTITTGLTPGTAYQFYVTQNCAAGANSGQAGPATFSTTILNDDCAGAINVPVQFGTCVGQTSADNTAATSSAGVPAPTCANYLGRDVWFNVTVPASGSVMVETVPPTAGSAIADTGMSIYAGACTTLTEVQCDDDGSPNGFYSLISLTGRTPGEVLYIRVWAYGNNNSGLLAVCVTSPSNCAVPAGPTATNLTNTTAQLSWVAPTGGLSAGNTYTLEYGLQGFVQGNGTSIMGLTATTTTLTGLAANTAYCYYVRQNCGAANGSSAFAGPTCFTTPLMAPTNDEPCGAITLNGTTLNSSNVGATTSIQNGVNLPACSSAQQPKDVWFAFTPAGTSTTLTLTGNPAGMVRIFSSPSCSAGPFASVFCQATGTNNTGFTAPIVVTGLTARTRYYVAVSGHGSSDTTGPFAVGGTSLLATNARADVSALLVFPNPSATGQLALRLNGARLAGPGQATLLNALGQVVFTKALSGTAEQVLSTRGLAAGLYTLRVDVAGQSLTRKVVLE